jgi:Fe-S-cluster containining protein
LTCGTCCFSLLAAYVRVTGNDHARLAERADELVWFDGILAYMRMTEGHCAALRVEPASGRFFCSAYETRPDVCRDLLRGSGECRAELDAKADRPVLSLGLRRRPLA